MPCPDEVSSVVVGGFGGAGCMVVRCEGVAEGTLGLAQGAAWTHGECVESVLGPGAGVRSSVGMRGRMWRG